ncbi:AraC family transcriptional regulator, partial [Stenotrophomonas maltophilia]|nr:AraC family transcriptional regulator [Stenotrophomonas maltophilia]
MRQLSLADRGQTVSLDRSLDDVAPTCLGVARLGSLQTAGSS